MPSSSLQTVLLSGLALNVAFERTHHQNLLLLHHLFNLQHRACVRYVQCLRQVTERVVPQAAMDLDNFPGDLPAGSSSAFCTWLQPVADRLAKLLRALKTTTQSSWGGSAFAIVSVSAGPWHCDRCTLLNTSVCSTTQQKHYDVGQRNPWRIFLTFLDSFIFHFFG